MYRPLQFQKRSQQFIGVQSNPPGRRDARQQSRSFAAGNQWLKSSLNSNSFAETISDDFPVLQTQ